MCMLLRQLVDGGDVTRTERSEVRGVFAQADAMLVVSIFVIVHSIIHGSIQSARFAKSA